MVSLVNFKMVNNELEASIKSDIKEPKQHLINDDDGNKQVIQVSIYETQQASEDLKDQNDLENRTQLQHEPNQDHKKQQQIKFVQQASQNDNINCSALIRVCNIESQRRPGQISSNQGSKLESSIGAHVFQDPINGFFKSNVRQANSISSVEPDPGHSDTYNKSNIIEAGSNFMVTWRRLKYVIEPKWHQKLMSFGRNRRRDPTNQAELGIGKASNLINNEQVPSSKIVLDKLYGSFRSGELTAILGPSGAGKTTLLDCLTGLKRHGLSGSVQVSSINSSSASNNNNNQTNNNDHEEQKQQITINNLIDNEIVNESNLRVSIIPQNDHLMGHLTVYETLNYASKMKNCFESQNFNHKSNIKKIAQQLGIISCLDTMVNKLSGGQYKRVSIAQELLSSPDVLILDEPTSGLDAMTCYQTVQVLRELTEINQLGRRRMAVILTIHQPNSDVFQQFNHVYVVAQGGKCIFEGPPSNIESIISRIGIQVPSREYNQATLIVEVAAGKFGLEAIDKLNAIQRKQYDLLSSKNNDEQTSTGDSAVECPSSTSSFSFGDEQDEEEGEEVEVEVEVEVEQDSITHDCDDDAVSNRTNHSAINIGLQNKHPQSDKGHLNPAFQSDNPQDKNAVLSGKQYQLDNLLVQSQSTRHSKDQRNQRIKTRASQIQILNQNNSGQSRLNDQMQPDDRKQSLDLVSVNQSKKINGLSKEKSDTNQDAVANDYEQERRKQSVIRMVNNSNHNQDDDYYEDDEDDEERINEHDLDKHNTRSCRHRRKREKRIKLNSLKSGQKFPFYRHTYLHFHRSWLSIVRDPMLCGMQLTLHILVPVMVSLVYGSSVGKPNACPRAGPVDLLEYALEPQDSSFKLQEELRTTLENIGYIFFKLYGIIFAAMTVTVLTFPLDMHVLVKEFRNGWYGLSSYFLGRTLADVPFQLTLPLLAMSLSYYATGQPYSYMQWRFLSITAILILSSLIAQSQGLLFGAILMDKMKAAVFVAPAATTPIILFAGFLVRTQSIPAYLRPLSNLSYLRYAIEACLISRYGFNQCDCDPSVFNRTVPEMPPMARSMIDYWLSSFKNQQMDEASSSGNIPTISPSFNATDYNNLVMTTTTTTSTSAPMIQQGNPDLFAKLMGSFARANSFGRNITSCDQVVPYPMLDYNLDDSQLLHCFAVLTTMLVLTRLLTFFIVSFKVKRKV